MTSNETLINKVYTIPGVSDHEGVCIKANLKPKLVSVKPRKVFIYSKANWKLLKLKMETFKTSFISNFSGKSVHTLWEDFKTALDRYMIECIPSKIIKGKPSLPWINQDIRRTARRRNKMYCRHKYSRNPIDRNKYLDSRHACRKKIKQSYENYINGIIGADLGDSGSPKSVNSKKLFSFLKHSRRDKSGNLTSSGKWKFSIRHKRKS